ncbi:MAG: glycosyltransferase family 2 protein [Candidatus Sericytochromatia bacterium]|nr:glycosyltransferase family 2 protein [Candidatus Sericytochromatia bacterium]
MKVSIVVPVYNEVDNLVDLHAAIVAALAPEGLPFEVIYVDDGSQDGSFETLRHLAEMGDGQVIAIRLRRNFGQTAAMAAGFDMATGDVIVPLDADLQNDPRDIPAMLVLIAQGYDVVSGWRKDRQDNWLRKIPSRIANRLISWATNVPIHDFGCTLKAYRRDVLAGVRLYGEMHRFIPAHAAWSGINLTEMVVRHHPRTRGVSKYGIGRTFRVVLDLITVKFIGSFGTKPIYVFGGAAFFMAFAGMLSGLFVASRVLLWDGAWFSPMIIITLFLLAMSWQTLLLGLVAEMVMRTYYESQGKRIYAVREVVGRSAELEPACVE